MRLLLIFLVSISLLAKNAVSAIFESADSYAISNVTVTSSIKDRNEAERELIAKAKISAFLYVQMYIDNERVNPNNVDVDSFLVEFSIQKVVQTEDGFMGEFSLTFDKAAMDSFLIAETRRRDVSTPSGDTPIFIRVDITRNLTYWSRVKNMLKSENIKHDVVLIDADFIELAIFGFKDLSDFEELALKRGYQIFKNNDFFFIRSISAYDDK